MADETIPVPAMEKLVFTAKLSGSLQDIQAKIKPIPLYASSIEGNVLTIVRVESRNIKKMPYLFYLMELAENQCAVSYSIPQDTSLSMRRAQVLREISALVSLVSENYSIDQGMFMQYVDSTLDMILKGLSQSYNTLFNQYNTMLSEYRSLKRLNLELSASNRNLTVQAAQYAEENKKLSSELNKLQKYSDESLMVMVQDWIEVHDQTIDINEFSKSYNIAATRVEEILDKMVSLGYLELRS